MKTNSRKSCQIVERCAAHCREGNTGNAFFSRGNARALREWKGSALRWNGGNTVGHFQRKISRVTSLNADLSLSLVAISSVEDDCTVLDEIQRRFNGRDFSWSVSRRNYTSRYLCIRTFSCFETVTDGVQVDSLVRNESVLQHGSIRGLLFICRRKLRIRYQEMWNVWRNDSWFRYLGLERDSGLSGIT